MEEIKDQFTTCPHCGSSVCYQQTIGDVIITYTCLSCGYATTSKMVSNSEEEIQYTGKQPQLYKDLRFIDKQTHLVWYPSVIASPNLGMVYIDGTSTQDWQWVATPFRELTRKEQRMKQYKGKKFIADSTKTVKYGQDGFIKAAVSLGFFDGENK